MEVIRTLGILTSALVTVISHSVGGSTWYVNGSVPQSGDGTSWATALRTIQNGMNKASDGDTVLVAQGTYVQNIDFKGKNIVLRSTDPLNPDVVADTIIDGNAAGSVVSFAGTEDETCVLDGFTIRNGKAAFGGGIRGRMRDAQTHATLRNNRVIENSAGRGGGVYDCDGLIENNLIADNVAEGAVLQGTVYGDGAGLYRCDGVIRSNTITRNSTRGGGCPTLPCVYSDGGGLTYCNGIIENNVITENTADRGGGLLGCNGTIRNNTVSDNHVNREGGGLAYCDATIEGNTISDNSAPDEGGGLAYCDGIIRNNLVSDNFVVGPQGFGVHGGAFSDCDGAIQNNTVTGNSAFHGGAMTFCDGTIEGNTITGNTARGNGGALYYCQGIIQNNVFSTNSAASDGGALNSCWGAIQNNLVIANSAGGFGGGLAVCRGSIQNNTVVGNSAAHTGGGLYNCRGTIGNCILWDNTASADAQVSLSSTPFFSCIQDWTGSGEGNIAPASPGFADIPGGDYHLGSDSPCIDAGANYYWFVWPQRDLDRNCRLAGESIDMGCYEYGATPDTDGDLLSDLEESAAVTSPQYPDSDGDGLRDGLELLRHSNPRNPTPPRLVHIPADLPGIQAALLLAVNGEEIVVGPGTYRENLHFYGVDVILRSSDPENLDVVNSTVLDGNAAGPTVTFTGDESDRCLLSGFTITGGLADSGGGIRGGRLTNRTHATIQNNVITGNIADLNYGGGICYCNGTIRNNTIVGNSVTRHGGGLALCDGTIRNNTIVGNSAGAYGGGLYICNGSIQNNLISDNVARGTFVWRGKVYGDGGALALCRGTIFNNRVLNNRALRGGALALCEGAIHNNLLVGNLATEEGGALHSCRGAILNNTVIANHADKTGGGLFNCTTGSIQNCILWSNTAPVGEQLHDSITPNYSSIQDWTGGGEGNTADEPSFLDPDGPDNDPETLDDNNYHLSADSPCIDAGRNEEWMWQGALDLDGNPRILRGRSSLTVDMGVYEFIRQGAAGAVWRVDDSVPQSGDGTSWQTAFKTIQEGINAASEGDTVIVAAGTYPENISFHGKNIVLRNTDPLDPTVVASTMLTGGRTGPVVTFDGNETETCVLSGFTLRDGKAPYGGGICGGNTSLRTRAAIRNNLITANSANHGAGVAFCNGAIENNTISANSAIQMYSEGGGLAYCDGPITNNKITRNTSVWRGGGLSRCNGTIQGNTVSSNSSSSGAGLAYCAGLVQSNVISSNKAKVWGGGLYWCDGAIQSNLVSGNTAGWGGGLASCDGAILNNTIVGNTATNSGGGLAWCQGPIRNCILSANAAPSNPQLYDSPQITFSCIEDWTAGGEGNISPPVAGFVDPDGRDNIVSTYEDNEYHLAPDSPCIDAGKNDDSMWRAIDLDGNPRIFYGKSSLTVEMGAYEYNSFPFRIVNVSPLRGGAQLTWTSRPQDTYTVWSCLDLLSAQWIEEVTVPSQGNSTTWTDPGVTARHKFYRIETW